jgi:plastocyanin
MSRRVRMLGGSLALALVCGCPVAAQATTKSVDLGPPRAAQKAFGSASADVNDFFPHRVTIHVGDSVRFVPSGFHTADLPGRRTRKLPIITPVGQTISGSTDAAGAPFWFNGQNAVGLNPRLLRSAFGKRRTYTGATAVLSGLPLARNPKPMTVRFTRAGTFRYFCDVHFGMTGVVRVVRPGRPVPSAAADRRTVRRQIAAGLRIARALPSTVKPPANTVDMGLQGGGNASFFGFVPNTLTVPRGTTVTFRMTHRSDTHTATIGPGDPEKEPASYLGQLEASLQQPVFDARAVFPSEPPGALAALTPTFHGNGFWNSGALDLDPGTPIPTSNAVNFAAPGTYQVFCMIHPFMHATVTVT